MSSASSIARGNANLGGAKTGIDFSVLGIGLDASGTLTAVFKTLETRKTWGVLADMLNLNERVAKHRIGGTRAYTVDELRTLLQGEDGLAFLEALMADSQPRWWLWTRKVMKLAAVRKRQAEDHQEVLLLETSGPVETGSQRRLKGIRDADRRLSSAVAEKETALGFLRPDGNGSVHRPVAQTARPRR